MAGKKRKTLTIEEKVEIIRELEQGTTNATVCKMLNLSSSTVSNIWKTRDRIIEGFEKNKITVKKLRNCSKVDLDNALLDWFKVQSSLNIAVRGPTLKNQAEKIAAELGYSNFVCSSGWMDRFKKRYHIKDGKIMCQTYNITDTSIESALPGLMEDYLESDIFNADEVLVSFKLSEEENYDEKYSTEHITVLLCTNMNGSEKRKLLVIGKLKKPHLNNLPIKYRSNVSGTMTSTIFEEEFRYWNTELEKQNRRILLIVDVCSFHSRCLNFSNIQVVFLTPNSTAILQPMEQGIIESLKYHFKKVILEYLHLTQNEKLSKISFSNVARLLNEAWLTVPLNTIKNSFIKSGLRSTIVEKYEEDEMDNKEDVLFYELERYDLEIEVKSIQDCGNNGQHFKMPELVDVKESNFSDEETGIEEYDHLVNEMVVESAGEDSNTDDQKLVNEETDQVVTAGDARIALRTLWRFCETNDVSSEFQECLRKMQDIVNKSHLHNLRKNVV